MNIFINILVPFLCLLIGYIFGSIPNGIIIGKLFFHQDPRNYGSGNPGGTNCGRIWGLKWGFIVILLDMLKTLGFLWLGWAILTFVPFNNGAPLCPSINDVNQFGINTDFTICYPVYYLIPIGGAFGHCCSIFTHFTGGKGAATYMGISIGSSWFFGFIPGLSYLLILKIKKTVSLASILVPVIEIVISWTFTILGFCGVIPTKYWGIFMYGPTLIPGWTYSLMLTLVALIVVIRHIPNIKRLKNGEERTIKWMK